MRGHKRGMLSVWMQIECVAGYIRRSGARVRMGASTPLGALTVREVIIRLAHALVADAPLATHRAVVSRGGFLLRLVAACVPAVRAIGLRALLHAVAHIFGALGFLGRLGCRAARCLVGPVRLALVRGGCGAGCGGLSHRSGCRR